MDLHPGIGEDLSIPLGEVRPDLVIPPEVEAITRRLLEKQPDDRPQTAEALIRELEEIDQEIDEIYRRVVTSEFAAELGIEIRRALPTRLVEERLREPAK